MVRDYLDWAAEQVGIARLIAYLLPLIAVVSLVGGVAAYLTKDDGTKSNGLTAVPTAAVTRPPTQPTVAQPGNLTPPPPAGTVPPANTTPGPAGTPRPPGSPVPGTPGAATPAPAGTPRPGTPAPATTPAPPAGTTYTVVSGDTGFGIATKLGVPGPQQQAWLTELARLNNMPNANSLRVGQVLTLPPIPGAAPAAPGGTTPPATPRP